MIIKWKVSNWLSAPERAEYTKQTTHFYIKANGGRDSIICRYYSYFDSEADALVFIKDTKAKRLHAKNVDRIKSHGVELLEALENLMARLDFYDYPDEQGAARAAIVKARGDQ